MTQSVPATHVRHVPGDATDHSSFACRAMVTRRRTIRHFYSVPVHVLTLAIRAYQLTLSPLQTYLFGSVGGCRYTPSCSNYAMDALREHGAVGGTFLAAKRICRCHPWGGCGHDPVPPKSPDSEIRISKPITF